MAKLTTNGRVGWRFESRLCVFAPPEGHTETQGRDYTHHTCGRRSRVRTPLNHTMCASPYKNRDLIHDLLGLSPPLPNQAPGPGTWSLLEKSSLTKSKTCIIGSKFFATFSGVIAGVTSPVRIAPSVVNDAIRFKIGSVWFIVLTSLANFNSDRDCEDRKQSRLDRICCFKVLDFKTCTCRARKNS